MAALRTTGSFRRFFVEGEALDLENRALCEAIENNAFRAIRDSGGERESIGWVSPWDPSGRRFDLEEMRLGTRLALALRVDQKRIPPTLLRIRCDAEERAELDASGQARLSRTQRTEIRQRIELELCQRALPSVALHLALLDSATATLLFYGTSTRVLDQLIEIFPRTFDRMLSEASPGILAQRLERAPERLRYIEQTGPLILAPPPRRLVRFAPPPTDGEGDGELAQVELVPAPARENRSPIQPGAAAGETS